MDLQCPFNSKASKYPAITLTSRALKVFRKLRSQNLYSLSVVIKAVTSGGKARIFFIDYEPSTNNSFANLRQY